LLPVVSASSHQQANQDVRRRTLVIAEHLEHYHRERNHQGLDSELIAGAAAMWTIGPVRFSSEPL